MEQAVATVSAEAEPTHACRHYWLIEASTGRVSRGVCKYCGAQRNFHNYLQDCLKQDREDYIEWVSAPENGAGEHGIFSTVEEILGIHSASQSE
ncbi:MAG: hypothetical protein DRI39_04375 [Chloroflexi bacterium]|nr:MAG: hypothetical protein DRI39_04375 [Chloroflexota bacterium]RLC97328.1 MAG: hypothetical protein DRI40_00520 [Chloroflexota bacterium]